MAQQQRGQDILSKLADRGEQVIGRITDLPGAKNLVDSVHTMRERVDELQKRVRGLDQLEKRLKDLEKRVKALEGTGARSRSTAKKTTSTKASGPATGTRRRSAPKKPS